MFTFVWVLGKLFFIATLILSSLLAGFKMPRRKYFILRFVFCVTVIIGEALVWRAFAFTFNIRGFSPLGLLDFFLQYVLVVLLIWACFDCNFWAALFCSTVGYCLEHSAERLFEIVKKCGVNSLHIFPQYLIRTAIFLVICTVVYFLIMRRSKYYSCAVMVDNKLQTIVTVCIIAVVTFGNSIAINFVYQIGNAELMRNITICIYAISSVFAFVGIVLEFSMSSNKNREEELSVIKRILKEERERYNKEKLNIELINIKCHDLRHQIHAFNTKLDEKEIESISNTINIYDSDIHTGNDAIDVVLTEKSLICRKNGIKLKCMLDGTKFNYIPSYEIYSLFGNALENAVNAVLAVEPEKRIISITDSGKEKLANVCIENYYNGHIEFYDGLPQTVKDNDAHGFGMKSMRYLIEKYGGALKVSVSEDIFRLNIFLPLEPSNPKL